MESSVPGIDLKALDQAPCQARDGTKTPFGAFSTDLPYRHGTQTLNEMDPDLDIGGGLQGQV